MSPALQAISVLSSHWDNSTLPWVFPSHSHLVSSHVWWLTPMPSICIRYPWYSWTSVVILRSEKYVPDPITWTVFCSHDIHWRFGQLTGWPRLRLYAMGTLLAHYLGILSWITSLLLVRCRLNKFLNSHVLLPCALWVLYKWLTDILKTWWFQSCGHVTPLNFTQDIIPSCVCWL